MSSFGSKRASRAQPRPAHPDPNQRLHGFPTSKSHELAGIFPKNLLRIGWSIIKRGVYLLFNFNQYS